MGLCLNSVLADEIPENWTLAPSGKPIIVTADFCELCNCCLQIPDIPGSFPFSKSDLPQSYGTMSFPPLLKGEVADGWQQFLSESESMSLSPELKENMFSGAAIRALVDLCEVCECCFYTPEALIIDRGAGDMQNLESYRVFVE